MNQTAIPPNQEIALGNYDDGDISIVEPRGFEPLTSAVQRRQDTLPEVSGACKMPANCRICPSARFSRFQEIYSGCCTVAAQTLPLLPPHKVGEDRYSTSRL